jgi:hypothetical protein
MQKAAVQPSCYKIWGFVDEYKLTAMDKKSSSRLDRLQRVIDADRPSEEESKQVADQLITQDQLRKVHSSMKKLAAVRPRPAKKAPPSAAEIASNHASPHQRADRPQDLPTPL